MPDLSDVKGLGAAALVADLKSDEMPMHNASIPLVDIRSLFMLLARPDCCNSYPSFSASTGKERMLKSMLDNKLRDVER